LLLLDRALKKTVLVRYLYFSNDESSIIENICLIPTMEEKKFNRYRYGKYVPVKAPTVLYKNVYLRTSAGSDLEIWTDPDPALDPNQ
jgi:hypothetical protein